MTSKQRERRVKKVHELKLELDKSVEPLTDNQEKVFNSDQNCVLHGVAGTGKTFISSYLAYKDIIVAKNYNKLIYVRSAVSTRNIGFLPGTDKEKNKVYEAPYEDIAIELFNRGDAYEILKQKGIVEFMTTSFVRGLTWNDAVIIVDECQNMSFHELDSIITRVGLGCKIYFCGDWRQADLAGNGIVPFFKILKEMGEFDFVEFDIDDIVRSEFVRNYLIAKYKVHDESTNK